MKKVIMLLAVTMLLFGVSGQAMADFAAGDLVRVVYQTGGSVEQITDLGAMSSHTTAFTSNISYTANKFSTSTFGGVYTDLQVAYFVYGGASSSEAWTSGPLGGTQTSGSRQGSGYDSNAGAVFTVAIANSNGTGNAVITQNNAQSYFQKMDKGVVTNVGGFGGYITPDPNGEANLAALATVGYVDQSLYYYSANNSKLDGLKIATIRTFADGHTEVNPTVANTPIPAAVYLLGSGLIGLVGIRRKMTA